MQNMMMSSIHQMAAASSDEELKDMASINVQDDSSVNAVILPPRWMRGRRGGRRMRQKQKREAAARAGKTGDLTMNVDAKGLPVFADHLVQDCPFGSEIMNWPELGSAVMDADYMKFAPTPGEVPATRLA